MHVGGQLYVFTVGSRDGTQALAGLKAEQDRAVGSKDAVQFSDEVGKSGRGRVDDRVSGEHSVE